MPEPTERRWAFSALPVHCLRCDKRVHQQAYMMHGGVFRCDGCHELNYVVILNQIQLCLLVEISSAEHRALVERHANPREVLESLRIPVRAA